MAKPLLKIENLHVFVDDKKILDNITLSLNKNEVIVVLGPNGSGKTSLLLSIMGYPKFKIDGEIYFDGKRITRLGLYERAKLGIGLAYQHPPEILGVKLKTLLDLISKEENIILQELIAKFKLKELLDRDINVGFSGGERKKVEILQLLAMKAKLLLLDEPDSGVDVESLRVIGETLNDYLKRRRAAAIVVTHTGDILEFMEAKKAYVLLNGRFACFGDPYVILEEIQKRGYEECVKCMKQL